MQLKAVSQKDDIKKVLLTWLLCDALCFHFALGLDEMVPVGSILSAVLLDIHGLCLLMRHLIRTLITRRESDEKDVTTFH